VSNVEVSNPILNSPFEEPQAHWWILPGGTPERLAGRRFTHYFHRDSRSDTRESAEVDTGTMIELKSAMGWLCSGIRIV